jgi:hypothetical protein
MKAIYILKPSKFNNLKHKNILKQSIINNLESIIYEYIKELEKQRINQENKDENQSNRLT